MSPLDVVQLALNVGGYRPMLIDVSRHIHRSSVGLPAERDGESSTAWIDPDLALKPSTLIRRLEGAGGDSYILRRASCYLAGAQVKHPGASTQAYDPQD